MSDHESWVPRQRCRTCGEVGHTAHAHVDPMPDPTLSLAEAVRELQRRIRDAETMAQDHERHNDARRQALWEHVAGELFSFEQFLACVAPATLQPIRVGPRHAEGEREAEVRAAIARVEPAVPVSARLWEMVDSLYDGLTAARARIRAHEDDKANADLDRLIEGIATQRAALLAEAPDGQ